MARTQRRSADDAGRGHDAAIRPEGAAMPLCAFILDDNRVDRLRLMRAGARSGLPLEFAELPDLGALLNRLDRYRPDLVFIDFLLGLDTGLDALDILARHPNGAGCVSIMVTGHADEAARDAAFRRGCRHVLPKDAIGPEALADLLFDVVADRAASTRTRDATAGRIRPS